MPAVFPQLFWSRHFCCPFLTFFQEMGSSEQLYFTVVVFTLLDSFCFLPFMLLICWLLHSFLRPNSTVFFRIMKNCIKKSIISLRGNQSLLGPQNMKNSIDLCGCMYFINLSLEHHLKSLEAKKSVYNFGKQKSPIHFGNCYMN